MISLLQGLEYVYYLVLPIVGGLIILALLYFIIRNINKSSFHKKRHEADNKIIIALGNKENIISAKATGSRLSLELKDYSLVKDEELKTLGVSSIIKMSNKITLVIGQEAESIANLLNK